MVHTCSLNVHVLFCFFKSYFCHTFFDLINICFADSTATDGVQKMPRYLLITLSPKLLLQSQIVFVDRCREGFVNLWAAHAVTVPCWCSFVAGVFLIRYCLKRNSDMLSDMFQTRTFQGRKLVCFWRSAKAGGGWKELPYVLALHFSPAVPFTVLQILTAVCHQLRHSISCFFSFEHFT